jgi:hypothetical protein
MRFTVRQEKIDHPPYPVYWFCRVDTGLWRRHPTTDELFHQNYDPQVYQDIAGWCEYQFRRHCRTRYNEFYFRTRAELDQFIQHWQRQ